MELWWIWYDEFVCVNGKSVFFCVCVSWVINKSSDYFFIYRTLTFWKILWRICRHPKQWHVTNSTNYIRYFVFHSPMNWYVVWLLLINFCLLHSMPFRLVVCISKIKHRLLTQNGFLLKSILFVDNSIFFGVFQSFDSFLIVFIIDMAARREIGKNSRWQ